MVVCIFERRSQNDRVHEHIAERNANVRFIKGAMKMTFYQELQLSSTGSKQLIRNTTDKKKKEGTF